MILGQTYDPGIGEGTMSRPVYAYPFVAQYDGQGDPADATSPLPTGWTERT